MNKVFGIIEYSSKKEMKQIVDNLKKEFSKVKININKQEKYIDYLTFVEKPFAMT